MAEQGQAADTEWVDIVDEQNEVIAQSSRQQMRAERLRHRATYIVVHDGMGKILVQRRTEIKDLYPGWLDATAGGVVQSGENVLDSARREAKKSWASPVCLSPNTVCSTSKKSSAGCGARCSAAYRTAHSRCRKKKWPRCAG